MPRLLQAHRLPSAPRLPCHHSTSYEAPRKEEIGIVPGEAFVYYRYESTHPYHEVHNLLKARTIDLIVEFKERGPSSRRTADDYEDESQEEYGRVLRNRMGQLVGDRAAYRRGAPDRRVSNCNRARKNRGGEQCAAGTTPRPQPESSKGGASTDDRADIEAASQAAPVAME